MSNWRAFWLGEMYGMGLWSVGAFWLFTSIHTYGDTPALLALLMIGFVGLGMGLFHGALAVIFNRFVAKQPLSFASLWVIQEWLKTWLFTGFPWLFVGYAYTAQPWLTSLAPIFGVLALSFVSVFVSASLVERREKNTVFNPIVCDVTGKRGTVAYCPAMDDPQRHAESESFISTRQYSAGLKMAARVPNPNAGYLCRLK
ncbi:apolipoprotein N-acyltransferase [Xanthomonas citri pv. aurantifolii str. ICPB 10535]|nr:apolipoprotein N-acyltransferase [Xanthomonas citri pv. aurantifolii str. ICPB 10535]